MGAGLTMAIISERENNGPYKDIYDLMERVNLSLVNRKCFESLALSGAFDSFGSPRELFFALDSKGTTFMEALVRYGQLFQQEKQQAQNSLFGGFDDIEIAKPKPGQFEEWSAIEKLNKERDLVGIYLSAHPLDEYRVILENMCNTHPAELGQGADREELSQKESITLGGIVTGIRTGFTKNGNPMGRVTIEDFENSGELAFFGQDWAKWSGMMQEGCSIYITMKCAKKFQNSNYYNIDVIDMQFLQKIKEESLHRITIAIPSKQFEQSDASTTTENDISDFSTILSKKAGPTEACLEIMDSESGKSLKLRVKNTITVTSELLDFIKEHENWNYYIN